MLIEVVAEAGGDAKNSLLELDNPTVRPEAAAVGSDGLAHADRRPAFSPEQYAEETVPRAHADAHRRLPSRGGASPVDAQQRSAGASTGALGARSLCHDLAAGTARRGLTRFLVEIDTGEADLEELGVDDRGDR